MKCEHPGDRVSADICQGEACGIHSAADWRVAYTVQWCQLCGAYRLRDKGPWIEPRSLRANIVDSDEDRAAMFVTNGPVREKLVEEFEKTRLEERERGQHEIDIWRRKAQLAEAKVVDLEAGEEVWRTTLSESRTSRNSAEAYGYQRALDEHAAYEASRAAFVSDQKLQAQPAHEVGPSCPPGCDGRGHGLL